MNEMPNREIKVLFFGGVCSASEKENKAKSSAHWTPYFRGPDIIEEVGLVASVPMPWEIVDLSLDISNEYSLSI
jgi:hypothetical protein